MAAVDPFIKYQGQIYYSSTFIDFATACSDIVKYLNRVPTETHVMGFDMEWPYSHQGGSGKTALIQISPNLQECYLFHVYHMRSVPAIFAELMHHPKARWTGVYIKNDIRKLARDFRGINGDLICSHCIDAGVLANSVFLNEKQWWSMAKLVTKLFNMQINKSDDVRMSKWDVLPLSQAQITYAAIDSYVSLRIYESLKKLKDEMQS